MCSAMWQYLVTLDGTVLIVDIKQICEQMVKQQSISGKQLLQIEDIFSILLSNVKRN